MANRNFHDEVKSAKLQVLKTILIWYTSNPAELVNSFFSESVKNVAFFKDLMLCYYEFNKFKNDKKVKPLGVGI